MASVAVIARRLIDRRAFALAVALLVCAGSARGMWLPLRLDHHGWQLAMLAVALAALADPKRARGGALLGGATALSLAIGLEMLLYLALAGAATVLRWAIDRDEARRLLAYGAALGGGCALAFLVFANGDAFVSMARNRSCLAVASSMIASMITSARTMPTRFNPPEAGRHGRYDLPHPGPP